MNWIQRERKRGIELTVLPYKTKYLKNCECLNLEWIEFKGRKRERERMIGVSNKTKDYQICKCLSAEWIILKGRDKEREKMRLIGVAIQNKRFKKC